MQVPYARPRIGTLGKIAYSGRWHVIYTMPRLRLCVKWETHPMTIGEREEQQKRVQIFKRGEG